MKRVLFLIPLMALAGYAAPLELEGGALYVEAADTTLSFEAPDDGIVIVGYVLKGDAMAKGVNLIMDADTLMYYTINGGAGASSESNTIIVSVAKGNHTIYVRKPLGSDATISKARIWVLFWPKKSLAVAEDPGMPPIMMLATLCRAGTPISLPQAKTAVYDATGKLVERPTASWTPTEAGTYFVQSGKQAQKVTVVK